MRRSTSWIWLTAIAAFVASNTFAQPGAKPPRKRAASIAGRTPARSTPLRQIVPAVLPNRAMKSIPNKVHFLPPGPGPARRRMDPLLLDALGSNVESLAPTPGALLSFDGVNQGDNRALLGGSVLPPDTVGDVGPNHFVQMSNLVFEVFDKSGNSLLGPLPNNAPFIGFGGICENENDGDPIVLYDQLADRWILSQFAIGPDGHQCFAVSQTPDPTGSYYLYDFVVSPGAFNDYPKLGVWPDGYYMSANEFDCGAGPCIFTGPIATVFERDKMLAGLPARMVTWDAGVGFSLQPSDWEGDRLPPVGSPNTFVMAWDDETWGFGSGADGYKMWELAVDWSVDPPNSSFTALPQVNTAEFDADMCGFNACVPQPGTSRRLDTLSQFTMYRAVYRNFSSHETLLVNHTVDVNGSDLGGVRWTELRNGGSGWSVHQTGTIGGTDGDHRWMGSASMDRAGNIAVGYSVASSTTFPSLRYNSRAAADALGQMPGGEQSCVAGSGSQTSGTNRWGDYATISVDPVDGCTFWMTSEYYSSTASTDWRTRVCSFRLPDCNEPPEVAITAPAPGTVANAGDPIDLVASATDFEDGDLSAVVSWSSSLDGALGTGASLSPVLSVGDHTVTATVVDSGGLEDFDVLDVSVAGSAGPPEVLLTIDVVDPTEYGNKYGTDQHEVVLPVLFPAQAGESYELHVTGFDIDYNDEISVYLDDVVIGMLTKGPNNQLNGGDVIAIPTPASSGDVRIEFRQRRQGWKWGATNLLVTTGSGPPPPPPPPSGEDIVLTVGTVDETEYGNKYGTDMHEVELSTVFTGAAGTAYALSVTGYDIDYDDEISVHFNDVFIGNLSEGPSNQENGGDTFDLPVANTVDGTNRVVFRQRRPGWKWGVTDMLIATATPPPPPPPPGGGPPVVSLVIGQLDPNEYGNKYGSDEHLILLPVVFDGVAGASYLLEATGFDIDFNDEISVYLNDVFVGEMTKGPNNQENGGDSFALPGALTETGQNRIEFRQRVQGWKWGITDLRVSNAP